MSSTPPQNAATPTDAALASRLSLENGLRSKLTGMENAVARVASIKSRLRKNAEQARRDLASTISAQMEALRCREQQLVVELEEAVQRKESQLSVQQEQLNQHIGACQQSLECLRRASPTSTLHDVDVQEMLFRLTAVDMEPRTDAYLALQADTVGLRASLADWGRIVSDGDEGRDGLKAGESLPVEMEEYDDVPLAHKSVMWSAHRKRGTQGTDMEKRNTVAGEDAEMVGYAVRDWLANMRPSAQQVLAGDIGRVMEDVEYKSTSGASDFEVIDSGSVIDAILKNRERPLSDWLPPVIERGPEGYIGSQLHQSIIESTTAESNARSLNNDEISSSSSFTAPIPSSIPTLPGLRTHPSLFAPQTPNNNPTPSSSSTTPMSSHPFFEFESVIGRVMRSRDDEWLMQPSSSSSSSVAPPTSTSSTTTSNEYIPSPTSTMTSSQQPQMISHAEAMERLARAADRMSLMDTQSNGGIVRPILSPSSTSTRSTVLSGAPAEFSEQWQRVFGRGAEQSDKWLAAKSS